MKLLLILTMILFSYDLSAQEIVKERFNTANKEIIGVWIEPEPFAPKTGPRKLVIYRQDWMDKDVYRLAYCSNDEFIWYPMIRDELYYSGT